MNKKSIYWGLIITFAVLYLLVAYVSLLHAVDFFGLGNNQSLSILLAIAYEAGQAVVLFSLLTTNNKHQFMTWAMMFLLTSLQITANVYSTFRFMVESNSVDWTYFQRVILFWTEQSGAEMYMITISWIIGAVLPLIALGMIALVSDNIKLMSGNVDLNMEYDEDQYEEVEEETIEEEAIDEVKEEAIDEVKEEVIEEVKEEAIEAEAIKEEIYTQPLVDEKDQLRLDFEDTGKIRHTDFDDILEKDISEIIKEDKTGKTPE